MNLTPMTKRLLILQALTTVVYLFLHRVTPDSAAWVDHYLRLTPSQFIRGQVWQVVSYLFLHAAPLHLLLNMLFLWIFGAQLEQRWGSRSFLRFFLLSGMGAGIVVVLAGLALPSSFDHPTLGMSGALNAMLMAFVIANPEATINFYFVLPVKAKHLLWIVILVEVLFALTGSTTSFPAHMGGLGMGYLLVTGKWRPSRWAFLANLRKSRRATLRGRAGNLRIVRPDDDDDDDEAPPKKYLN